ncbi:rhomboid family intramembrane serine protease [Agaricicola taiwanensis]|uniref:Rhomboid family intramembrane serine protease n=1 Tax=Agaricicola taiwanensis TaxID=591372 RepID=A0A8J2YJK2_9RHOB|nr:rhomboid family intramembrane serine protease [Agaricicola taiwanensis]GGE47884.1 rhomboid family intramembrane serine protease [Agaricicola taiwanensis]
MNFHSPHHVPRRERAFNAPASVLGLIAAFTVIYAVMAFLPERTYFETIVLFAFFPVRYGGEMIGFPGGVAADLWTFVTYTFLHGGMAHLVLNCVWLLVFGSPVAWRFGTRRFLIFCAVTAAAGALAHLLSHWGDTTPVIGASSVVSGATAAAMRFVFSRGGLSMIGGNRAAGHLPAEPLLVALRNPTVLGFIVVWFVLNLAFGLTAGDIAWEAHVGGFLAGLLLFPLFDPPGRGGYLRAA